MRDDDVVELKDKSMDVDMASWVHVMPIWPEATGGDVDPGMSFCYDIVMIRLGAEWLSINHPDAGVRETILAKVLGQDPYHETRGKPIRKMDMIEGRSVKAWRPAKLRGRIEQTVDILIGKYFEGLHEKYPGSGSRPVAPEIVARFRPCVISFFLHWLWNNFPNTKAVDRAADTYLQEDPLLMERCGAGNL